MPGTLEPLNRAMQPRILMSRTPGRDEGLARLLLALFLLGGLPGTPAASAADEDPFGRLRRYVEGEDRAPLMAIEARVRNSANNRLKAGELERDLMDILVLDATPDARRFACRQLRYIGTDRAVPALAGLLDDPVLAHPARAVLEAMPSAAAGAALRQALRTARGDPLLGVIHALGERRDPVAVFLLIPWVSRDDPGVVQAALGALGRIGGDTALQTLQAAAGLAPPPALELPPPRNPLADKVRLRLDQAVLYDGLLSCAEIAARGGGITNAIEVYAQVYSAPLVPRPQRMAAVHGLVRHAPARAATILLGWLRGQDPDLHAAAAALVAQLPADARAVVLDLFDALPASARVRLSSALAARADPALEAWFLRVTGSPELSVRLEALRALGSLEATPAVLERLREVSAEPGDAGAAARESLERLGAPR